MEDYRNALAAYIADRTRRRFARRSPGTVLEGEVSTFIVSEIRRALAEVEDPYAAVIRGWEGKAWQLDLTWWEEGDTPAQIVYGLAGAILDFEVRRALKLES